LHKAYIKAAKRERDKIDFSIIQVNSISKENHNRKESMEGEWAEVKAKKKAPPRPQPAAAATAQVGGIGGGKKKGKNVLVAGPVVQGKYGGAGAYGGRSAASQNEPEPLIS